MRQVGAFLIGLWYSFCIASSLGEAIKSLADDRSQGFGEHYILVGIAWLIGITLAAYIAGVASRKYPLALSILTVLPLPIVYSVVLLVYGGEGLSYRLPALMFGWSPTAIGFVFIFSLVLLVAGYFAGMKAKAELTEGQTDLWEEELYASRGNTILGIRWGHWYWLWLPISLWTGVVPGVLYLLWLWLATGWHWLFHPSLWFDWHWWLYAVFGGFFIVLPYGLLTTGMEEALKVLSTGKERGIGGAGVALRFIGWGFVYALILTSLSSFFAYWLLSHLPIVAAQGNPWWVFR